MLAYVFFFHFYKFCRNWGLLNCTSRRFKTLQQICVFYFCYEFKLGTKKLAECVTYKQSTLFVWIISLWFEALKKIFQLCWWMFNFIPIFCKVRSNEKHNQFPKYCYKLDFLNVRRIQQTLWSRKLKKKFSGLVWKFSHSFKDSMKFLSCIDKNQLNKQLMWIIINNAFRFICSVNTDRLEYQLDTLW